MTEKTIQQTINTVCDCATGYQEDLIGEIGLTDNVPFFQDWLNSLTQVCKNYKDSKCTMTFENSVNYKALINLKVDSFKSVQL